MNNKLTPKRILKCFWLIPWCYIYIKYNRCDWCFNKLEIEFNGTEVWFCSKCRWNSVELPSRWET